MAALIKWMDEHEDKTGKAAATGTAVGRAVELWIKHSTIEEAGQQALREASTGEVLPDEDQIWDALNGYASDPRNARGNEEPENNKWGQVVLDSLELEVELVLPPHETDPTGEDVYLLGHVDQVRRDMHGVLSVWDLKHSSKDPWLLNWLYSYQLACYAEALARHYGEPCEVGGIILTKSYLERTGKNGQILKPREVFLESALDKRAVEGKLLAVRRWVAEIRSGEPTTSPGDHCTTSPNSWGCLGGSQACLSWYDSKSEATPDLFTH